MGTHIHVFPLMASCVPLLCLPPPSLQMLRDMKASENFSKCQLCGVEGTQREIHEHLFREDTEGARECKGLVIRCDRCCQTMRLGKMFAADAALHQTSCGHIGYVNVCYLNDRFNTQHVDLSSCPCVNRLLTSWHHSSNPHVLMGMVSATSPLLLLNVCSRKPCSNLTSPKKMC